MQVQYIIYTSFTHRHVGFIAVLLQHETPTVCETRHGQVFAYTQTVVLQEKYVDGVCIVTPLTGSLSTQPGSTSGASVERYSGVFAGSSVVVMTGVSPGAQKSCGNSAPQAIMSTSPRYAINMNDAARQYMDDGLCFKGHCAMRINSIMPPHE